MAYLFGILAGISGSMIMLIIGVLRPFLYGRKYLGGLLGVFTVVTVIGSALGSLPFGTAYDRFGGYQEILIFSTILTAIAAILSLLIKKPALSIKDEKSL